MNSLAWEDHMAWGTASEMLVKQQITNAVAAARRKGVSMRYSAFLDRLRKRNPGMMIEGNWTLDELVRAAARMGVAVELDRDVNVTSPRIPEDPLPMSG